MARKREPVETMSRMDLMRECARWRERGPALEAVARAAKRCHGCGFEEVNRALARLGRASRSIEKE